MAKTHHLICCWRSTRLKRSVTTSSEGLSRRDWSVKWRWGGVKNKYLWKGVQWETDKKTELTEGVKKKQANKKNTTGVQEKKKKKWVGRLDEWISRGVVRAGESCAPQFSKIHLRRKWTSLFSVYYWGSAGRNCRFYNFFSRKPTSEEVCWVRKKRTHTEKSCINTISMCKSKLIIQYREGCLQCRLGIKHLARYLKEKLPWNPVPPHGKRLQLQWISLVNGSISPRQHCKHCAL